MTLQDKLALLVALALAAPALADADNAFRLKPGANGKICLECHVAVQETLELPHVHTPVKAGECSDCHNPHASEHGKLLAVQADHICSMCHDDIIPDGAKSVHAAIVEDGCSTCHDPHASEFPDGLAAAGNELCFGCHDDMAAKLNDARFPHPPAADDCLNCHNPHASTQGEFLLAQETSALCSDCHDTGDQGFIDRHMGYPVAGARCTSCHDPHGGATSAMMLTDVHAPLTRKMCNQCHNSPTSPDALSVKREGMELCRACHAREVDEILAADRLHWAVADGTGCLHCHSPHASNEQALLLEPMKAVCASCHENTVRRMEAAPVKHPPSEEGECTLCHSPHSSNDAYLLPVADVSNLCTQCHDWNAHTSHPIGKDDADPRNMNLTLNCLSCHEPHGSEFRALAPRNPSGDLCVQCHQQVQR